MANELRVNLDHLFRERAGPAMEIAGFGWRSGVSGFERRGTNCVQRIVLTSRVMGTCVPGTSIRPLIIEPDVSVLFRRSFRTASKFLKDDYESIPKNWPEVWFTMDEITDHVISRSYYSHSELENETIVDSVVKHGIGPSVRLLESFSDEQSCIDFFLRGDGCGFSIMFGAHPLAATALAIGNEADAIAIGMKYLGLGTNEFQNDFPDLKKHLLAALERSCSS